MDITWNKGDSWMIIASTVRAYVYFAYDVIAGTAVIYSWDARAARLRFLSRS